MYKTIHVVPFSGKWAVKVAGESFPRKTFTTQAEAERYANELGRQLRAETKIHRPDGTIRGGSSYGNDPIPPRDET